ncbi:MAG: hypothetical protein ACC645_20185, partial [Pirellulales bacterium]
MQLTPDIPFDVPLNTRTNEIQTLTAPGATAGTFNLQFGGAAVILHTPLNFNATAADVRTALQSLSTINPNDVVVSGGPVNSLTNPIQIEFMGQYAGQDVELLQVVNTSLDVVPTILKIQILRSPGATTGTFDLQFRGDAATLDFDATAAEVQAALESLAAIDPGDVLVSGGPVNSSTDPVQIQFTGQYVGQDVELLQLVNASLDVRATVTGQGDVILPLREHLENLQGIAPGEVFVTGGPMPQSSVMIRFEGRLVGRDLALTLEDDSVFGGIVEVDTVSDGSFVDVRTDARLAIDPGITVKLQGARIEIEFGAQLIAEGLPDLPVVFTSLSDDRFGFGGLFDTKNDGDQTGPVPGDWGGLYFSPVSKGSIDSAVIAFGGGRTPIEGDFDNFNVIEIHQAEVRIANSTIEDNGGGKSETDRNGRGANVPATIFVRGAQPVIVDNVIRDNEPDSTSAAISINANSLKHVRVADPGRTTGRIDSVVEFDDNYGPLVRMNRMANNGTNGLEVRAEELTTESIWDDTDIVHVVRGEILVTNQHTYGGLTLASDSDASLVVKLFGPTAGFTASGKDADIDDRIGGTLLVLGQPGFPVILTALSDNSVGAGFQPDGRPQTNTSSTLVSRLPTGPEQDNGLLIDNDVAAAIPGHFQIRPGDAGSVTPGNGSSGVTAQGNTQLFVDADFIFDFINYVDPGSDGNAIRLQNSTVTSPPALVSPDVVVSQGTFNGPNGAINWRVETRLDDGIPIVFNTVTFSSSSPFGDVRFVNYLDEDILGFSDDLLFLSGRPGAEDFRLFTLDNGERIGFSQGGTYAPGPDLINARYDGWAADQYNDLQSDIEGNGTSYSVTGNIDTNALPPFTDPELGLVYGLGDVTTAMAWTLDSQARTATVTTFLELIASNPGAAAGDWRGIKLEHLANDRNVGIANETEEGVTLGRDINRTPAKAQFLGDLAPNEQSGDENRRLGFELHGNISLDNPADVDVYSF